MKRSTNIGMIVVISIVVLLLVGRIALPYIVKDQVNKQLAALDDYTGHLEDIDIALWRGNYSIVDLMVEKEGNERDVPLLFVPQMDISIHWGALLDGRVVGEVELFSPEVHFKAAQQEEQSQTGADEPWYALLEELVPFTVNRFEVHDGLFTFNDTESDTPVDVRISSIQVLARNMSNVQESSEPNFADFEVSGLFADTAPLRSSGQLNPLASPPLFEVDFELETVDLALLNSLLQAYAGVEAEAGTFSVYAEFASADGLFEGYVRPILDNAEFVSPEENDGLLRKFWAATVDLAANILENPDEEQVASQIPFSGELENVEAGIIPAILSVLENAFIAALEREVEGSVGIEDVGAGDDSQ